ncbi:MAG: PAS domain S-box-containing protein [Lysobacterales bacterium]|jgi:PAS domain S-box-containing protein
MMHQDLTQEHIEYKTLEQTQAHLQGLVHSAGGILWEAHAGTFRFTFVNDAAERILGYPCERWLNEKNFWRDHIHPFDREMVVREYSDDTRWDHSHRIEYRMIAADGSVVWLDDQVTVIYKNGKPALLRGIMVEITKRKNLMEARRSLSQREGVQVENERRRIAQELQDDYSQRMAFMALCLQTLGEGLPKESSAQQKAVEDIWAQTKLLSTDMHNLAYELAPTSLRQLGLQGAISNLCDKYFKLHALPVDFVFENLPEHLSDSKAIALYRIVQEALNNVHEHSNAEDALVRLSGVNGNLELVVSDTGEGFDSSQDDRMQNLGLMGMEERAYMVGGSWSISSIPEQGTEIKVVVPLAVTTINE